MSTSSLWPGGLIPDWVINYQDPSDIEAPLASARPSQTSTPAGTPISGAYTLPPSLTDLPGTLQLPSTSTDAPGTANAVTSVVSGLNTTASGTQRNLSDYVGIGIGAILVIGGILFFKPVQNIVISGGRTAGAIAA